MEASTKTAVQIIQELIGLQSAKLENLTSKNNAAEQKAKENDPVITKLMGELSQHGDGVGSSVERTDLYYDIENHDETTFQLAIDNILKEAGELPESLQGVIQLMRNTS